MIPQYPKSFFPGPVLNKWYLVMAVNISSECSFCTKHIFVLVMGTNICDPVQELLTNNSRNCINELQLFLTKKTKYIHSSGKSLKKLFVRKEYMLLSSIG